MSSGYEHSSYTLQDAVGTLVVDICHYGDSEGEYSRCKVRVYFHDGRGGFGKLVFEGTLDGLAYYLKERANA